MSSTVDGEGAVAAAPPRAEQALQEVLASWNRAAESWDVEALAALYTEDALMFGGRPGLAVGVAGMRGYFGSYVDVLASAHLALVDQYLVELAPEVYLAQGFGVFKFGRVDGGQTGTTMRTTLVIARRDGRWKIRQHHFSSIPDKPPIDG
ncbi:MAG: hypothetical protein JWQ76_67 [Ramlibacter sp.]|nr:hypothetical protein [Ramlibacter sp.]